MAADVEAGDVRQASVRGAGQAGGVRNNHGAPPPREEDAAPERRGRPCRAAAAVLCAGALVALLAGTLPARARPGVAGAGRTSVGASAELQSLLTLRQDAPSPHAHHALQSALIIQLQSAIERIERYLNRGAAPTLEGGRGVVQELPLGMNRPKRRRKGSVSSPGSTQEQNQEGSASAAGLAGVLEVSRTCQRYQRTNTAWKRKNCAIEDCAQLQSATGCKYLSAEGMCYTAPGQTYCSLHAEDPNCHTKESGAIEKAMYEERSACKPLPPPDPFTLNFNCERYTSDQRDRYLQSCQLQDCRQSRSRCVTRCRAECSVIESARSRSAACLRDSTCAARHPHTRRPL